MVVGEKRNRLLTCSLARAVGDLRHSRFPRRVIRDIATGSTEKIQMIKGQRNGEQCLSERNKSQGRQSQDHHCTELNSSDRLAGAS